MRSLIAITAASDRNSDHSIAASAATELEQYARKGKSQYWNVIPATEPAPETKNETLTDAEPSNDGPEVVVAHKLTTVQGEQLVQDALDETITNAQAELRTLLETLTGGKSTDIGNPLTLGDPESVEKVLRSDAFISACNSIGDRFGDIYRVFDLTNHQHGYPVRSWETAAEIRDQYETHTRTVYAVKLHART